MKTRLIKLRELILGLKEAAALQAMADLPPRDADRSLIPDRPQKNGAGVDAPVRLCPAGLRTGN